jgi:ABC-type multidrug transport system fused ATPase/permease subunit
MAGRREEDVEPHAGPAPRSQESARPHRKRSEQGLGALLGLSRRTLPYLRPVLRELRPAIFLLPIFVLGVPFGMLATDLFMNRMLAGAPLTPFEASLLQLPVAEFVNVDALSVESRQTLRGLLVRYTLIGLLIAGPVIVWMINLFIKIQQRINQLLRVEMVQNVQAQSLRFHQDSRVGDAVYHTYQDSSMVTNLMAMLVRPIGPALGAAFGLALAALFDWRLSVGLALLYYSTYRLVLRTTPTLRQNFREARERNSALTSRIQESLSGIQVIKAYGSEPVEQARFEEASERAFSGAFRARTWLAALGIVSFNLSALPPILAGCYLALLANEGSDLAAGFALSAVGFAFWNLGAYASAMSRTGSAARSADQLLRMWAQAQDMAVGMERAFDQVDLTPEVQDAADATLLTTIEDGVAFRKVGFGYRPETPILRDVDLEAKIGTITALIGPTGSGKSTLVALLLRLFDPDSGEIEIDGIDLRQIQLESLRSHVGVALQENLLFGTTIRENIRYAVPEATEAQVREAARIACADGFIEALPNGYDTALGERGARLSTGQRQRLSIARAIIKDTPILILDEPTAALDAETELRVMENLSEWGRGRVILLITHRLSTIRRADQIAYLRDGRIIECDSHEALVRDAESAYAKFVRLETAPGPTR